MNTLALRVPRLEALSTVWIGRGIVTRLGELLPLRASARIVVVADTGVQAVLTEVLNALSLTQKEVFHISGGEQCKTLAKLEELWSFFLEQRLDRHSLIVAIGGGATTDVVGFAAATFMRGVRVVNIPTTLLAQVDASVGGKTGINFGGTKNLLGTIGQPFGVVVDIDTLASLPPRDLRSGFAEIVKHGLIADAEYFRLVIQKPYTAWSAGELEQLVVRSCQIKKAVVESDETETGPRKILNFGHTIGHAIESLLLHTPAPLTHGEAVAIGMAAESHLSLSAGRISEQEYATITDGIAAVGLPIRLATRIDPAQISASIVGDKKNAHGTIKWTQLDRIGHAIFDSEAPEHHVHSAIASIQP
jgi:3-dehydroquinate synthase